MEDLLTLISSSPDSITLLTENDARTLIAELEGHDMFITPVVFEAQDLTLADSEYFFRFYHSDTEWPTAIHVSNVLNNAKLFNSAVSQIIEVNGDERTLIFPLNLSEETCTPDVLNLYGEGWLPLGNSRYQRWLWAINTICSDQ